MQPNAGHDHSIMDYPDRSIAFRNFAMVWALASLFHMAHSGIFDSRLNLALLTIASLYVVICPGLRGFVVLILLQLVDVAVKMPDVTNHWIFTAFINLTILQSVLYCVHKKKSFNISEKDVYDAFAPTARIEVLILYFWAVMHKLNTGFFSADVSCATELLRSQGLGDLLDTFPQLAAINAYATVIAELTILIMLFFGRTRHAGIIVGFVFHAILSFSTYNAFYDFTSMMCAAYFLFTSDGFNIRVHQFIQKIAGSFKLFAKQFTYKRLMLVCVLIVFSMLTLALLNKILNNYKLFHLYFFWTLYVVAIGYLFIRFLFQRYTSNDSTQTLSRQPQWFMLLPALVFLNGASPYLGLKTENSYAMFSNLRTEGGVTNHYLFPDSLQIFNYQADLVEIVSSSDASLQRLADNDQLLVLFEFSNYLHKKQPSEVIFKINGRAGVFRRGETDLDALFERNNPILARLMAFRTISKHDPQPCSH